MRTVLIEEGRFIPASPATVYNIIADYRVGHKAILPKPYFADLRVIEGGFGAGSVIEVDMDVYGTKRTLQMTVSEPQPGKLLEEVDVNTGTRTEFIFEAREGGCQLTFKTYMNFPDGVAGFIEKLISPPIMHKMYREELENIVQYVQKVPQTA